MTDKTFHEILAGIDNHTTTLLGHTRWRTCGDEQINRNNQPIRAGKVIGTHNGTIYNADRLFRLNRFAQVESELLFRLANDAVVNGLLDMERFRTRFRLYRGRLLEMPSGIPVLQVPEENILAPGTADPLGRHGHTGTPC